jgi:hypothetical protein
MDFFRKVFDSGNIDPPRHSRRMQGLPPENLEGSQPFPTNPPEGSPQQSEVQETATPRVERTDSLDNFRVFDSLESFRLPHGSERHILRLNSSGELVVQTSGIPIGPFIGPEGQDPFWTTDIFRTPPHTVCDRFGSGVGNDISIKPVLPKTSAIDTIPSKTTYLFVGSDTQSVDPNSTIPFQMAHSTMVPNATTIPTRNTVASHAPIGTPHSPRPIPSLPPGYNALNTTIPIPTQVSSKNSRVSPPPGYNPTASFILTLPQVPLEGSYPPFTRGSDPSGITQSFTPNYQIPVSGKFHPRGQTQPGGQTHIGTQPPFGVQTPIGTQPLVGGQSPPTPPYGQNIPTALAQYWNFLT